MQCDDVTVPYDFPHFMKALTAWADFLVSLKGSLPLEFVCGFRHPVAQIKASSAHSNKAIEIVYHAAGSGRALLPRGRSLAFHERDVVIHAPMEPHNQIMDEDGEDICILMEVPHGADLAAAHSVCIEQIDALSIREDIEFLGRGHPQPDSIEQAILNLRATSLLMALLRQAILTTASLNSPQSDESYVLLAEKHIRDHYQSIDSIRSVAESTGIGYDHLRHLFKTVRGRSLIRYLNEIRIGQAKSLLVHSRYPIKQIATQCGFRDEYYFSAVFRNFVGIPPFHYRRQSEAPVEPK